jgi:hypothetical protein
LNIIERFSRKSLYKLIKFHKNLSRGSRVVSCWQTYMLNLCRFCNCAIEPKNEATPSKHLKNSKFVKWLEKIKHGLRRWQPPLENSINACTHFSTLHNHDKFLFTIPLLGFMYIFQKHVTAHAKNCNNYNVEYSLVLFSLFVQILVSHCEKYNVNC